MVLQKKPLTKLTNTLEVPGLFLAVDHVCRIGKLVHKRRLPRLVAVTSFQWNNPHSFYRTHDVPMPCAVLSIPSQQRMTTSWYLNQDQNDMILLSLSAFP